MIAISLGVLIMTMGFSGLNKARTSGGSRGLATAVAGEFRLAREKAIAKGSPVAVVIPGEISQSLFFLEGETTPSVTRTVDYSGDYPYGALTAATYPGPTFGGGSEMPGSKALAWKDRLDVWLPDEYAAYKVFMFIPNGSVITRNVSAADGTYRVVVSMGAEVDSGVLKAVGEPQTVAISASGAVEQFGRLLGNTGGVRTQGATLPSALPGPVSPRRPGELPASINPPVVTPKAEMVDGRLAHVLDKGEYLTLELFAHSNDGRALYASWNDTPLSKTGSQYHGAFSVPGAARERMEFYPEFDTDGDGVMEANVWRSVWTWTPPPAAESGDQYRLDVEVTDAEGTVKAELRKEEPVVISPPGEIVFESNRHVESNPHGRWQLFTMKANGKDVRQLTEGNHDYRCASATADGKMIAFQRGYNEVWVMNTDKTGQTRISTNGYLPCISPTGGAIAYMRDGGPHGAQVVVQRLDRSSTAMVVKDTAKTAVMGAPNPSNRLAFSGKGDWVYYTAPDKRSVCGTELSYAGGGLSEVRTKNGADVPNIAHHPEVGGIFAGLQGQVYYHADNDDPYFGRYETGDASTGGGEPGAVGGNYRRSVNQSEAYPAISPNQDVLLFCELRGGSYQIFSVPIGSWESANSGVPLTKETGEGENLRPAWIRQEKAL